MTIMRLFGPTALALCVLVAATGCREEEQDRILFFEHGVYRGHPDQPLDPQVIDQLRFRAARQNI